MGIRQRRSQGAVCALAVVVAAALGSVAGHRALAAPAPAVADIVFIGNVVTMDPALPRSSAASRSRCTPIRRSCPPT